MNNSDNILIVFGKSYGYKEKLLLYLHLTVIGLWFFKFKNIVKNDDSVRGYYNLLNQSKNIPPFIFER